MEQSTIPGLETAGYAADPIAAVAADIQAGIEALRVAGALQAHHSADIAFIYANLNSAISARGIARGNFLKQAREAFKDLPEPVIQETDDVVQFELERIEAFIRAYADSAALPDEAVPASVL
jgi:hypothetical protein